ncbi:3-deoxy-D-manno-octulosonate 8-phosphate phosphatase [Flaviaesturariibacter flavus]|uniref:3-deoxy-D-manno-octulosonate 8-phosphate phosphatase n=1 Tax=Flaviaesturariibacter flavus TaxID=2502780 RepID=A0A4R1BNW2_9BACT|nr:HAD hydrolase family protein [Flaviaesturariibacter flavus]TCJ19181.1 3-deoxy-D-manno-octulosonate 8-phosphate phosphatase [Flaviaesturariibacter flavus]
MDLLDQFKRITTFIFDVDGVLTDSTVLLLDNGLQARRMSIKDGLALQLALRHGYRVVICSGAHSEPVVDRMRYLGISEVHTAVKDKKGFIEKYCTEHRIDATGVLFMGDDLPDLPALQVAGLSACPADAAVEVREACTYRSPVAGGSGCVRDVIEKVLRLNGHWHYESGLTSK